MVSLKKGECPSKLQVSKTWTLRKNYWNICHCVFLGGKFQWGILCHWGCTFKGDHGTLVSSPLVSLHFLANGVRHLLSHLFLPWYAVLLETQSDKVPQQSNGILNIVNHFFPLYKRTGGCIDLIGFFMHFILYCIYILLGKKKKTVHREVGRIPLFLGSSQYICRWLSPCRQVMDSLFVNVMYPWFLAREKESFLSLLHEQRKCLSRT